jgi:hypothetical protein
LALASFVIASRKSILAPGGRCVAGKARVAEFRISGDPVFGRSRIVNPGQRVDASRDERELSGPTPPNRGIGFVFSLCAPAVIV